MVAQRRFSQAARLPSIGGLNYAKSVCLRILSGR